MDCYEKVGTYLLKSQGKQTILIAQKA